MYHDAICGRNNLKISFDKDLNCLADCPDSTGCPWRDEEMDKKEIKCPNCGKKIDSRLKICPKCQHRIILSELEDD